MNKKLLLLWIDIFSDICYIVGISLIMLNLIQVMIYTIKIGLGL